MPGTTEMVNRRSERRAFKLFAVLVMLFLLGWLFFWLAGEKILKGIAHEQINAFTGLDAQIERVSFNWRGNVEMRGFRVKSPANSGFSKDIIRAEELDVRFSLLSLLLFEPCLEEVRISGVEVNLERNAESGKFSWPAFKRGGGGSVVELPNVRISGGEFNYYLNDGENFREIISIPLEQLQFTFQKTDQGGEFSLETYKGGELKGFDLQGEFFSFAEGSRLVAGGNIINYGLPVLGNEWELDDIQVDVEFSKAEAILNNFSAILGGRTSIAANGRFALEGGALIKNFGLVARDVRLVNHPERDCVYYSEELLEKFGSRKRKFFDQYRPIGDCDVSFIYGELSRAAGKGDWYCKLKSKGGSILYAKFPYELRNIHGDLEITRKGVVVDEIVGDHGETAVRLNGEYFFGKTRNERTFDIFIESEEGWLDGDVYEALNEKFKRVWFQLTPSGKCGVKYHFFKKQGLDKQYDIDIELKGVEAAYQNFPYPIKDAVGRIHVQKGKVEFFDISSVYEGREINIEGEIAATGSANPSFDLNASFKNIPFDNTLRSAFGDRVRGVYDQFEVDGFADANVKVYGEWNGANSLNYSIKFDVIAKSLVYDGFPVLINDAVAKASISNKKCVVEDFKGKFQGYEVGLNGVVGIRDNTLGDDADMDFEFFVDEIELSEVVRNSLPEKVKTILEGFELTSSVDVAGSYSKRNDSKGVGDVSVRFDGNSLVYENQKRFDDLMGVLSVSEDTVVLEGFGGDYAVSSEKKIEFSVNGSFELENNKVKKGSYELEAKNVKIDRELFGLVSKSFDGGGEAWRIGGICDIEIVKGELDFTGLDKQNSMAGRVVFKEGVFGKDLISNFNGEVGGRVVYISGSGVHSGVGEVYVRNMDVYGRKITDLKTRLSYDHEAGLVTSRDFDGEFAGGRIQGGGRVVRNKQRNIAYTGGLRFDKVALDGMRFDDSKIGGDRERQMSGVVSGGINIEGIIQEELTRKGRVELLVGDVFVGNETLPADIVRGVVGQSESDVVFDWLKIDAYIAGHSLVVEDIFLIGKTISFRGKGRVDLNSKAISMELTAHTPNISGDFRIGESLANALGGSIARVEVRGKLPEPDIEIETFGIFKKN